LTQYGGDWFGLKTAHHISLEEYQKRENAAWPAATESTIVSTRTVEETPGKLQSGKLEALGEQLSLVSPPVSKNSIWAERLVKIMERRFGKEREGVTA
jgi:hypothetical protein